VYPWRQVARGLRTLVNRRDAARDHDDNHYLEQANADGQADMASAGRGLGAALRDVKPRITRPGD
jgi:hypothetical protein